MISAARAAAVARAVRAGHAAAIVAIVLLSLLLVLEGGGQAMKALLQAQKRYVLPAVASLAAIVASILWLLARSSRGPVAFVEATLVGDSIIDWRTGFNASISVCLVRYGFGFDGFAADQLRDTDFVVDTPQELLYYKNGGILQYVLRQLLDS